MRGEKLFLGADHAGFAAKEKIKFYLERKKINYKDLSPKYSAGDDYPDHAFKVAKKVKQNKNHKGILICGSGVGMAMAANKIKGIRAVAAYDAYTAKMSRFHNDANILALRARIFTLPKTEEIISLWLKTRFSNATRHKRRIKKLDKK